MNEVVISKTTTWLRKLNSSGNFMVSVRGQTTMVAPMSDPLQVVVPREPVVPEIGVEPPGPVMKTCVPGPRSLRLKEELNDIQVRVTIFCLRGRASVSV